ncbi:MAG: hypothetical protein K0R54_76 [Clostridiaceae bacterium]|jgi:hypothetical protein|nr:hypothetical protein [Clostridiaceae bacterium]
MTMKKNVSFIVILTVLLTILLSFGAPMIAFADGDNNDPGGIDVTVGEDGTLTIEGPGFDREEGESAFTSFINQYKYFITGFAGVAATTMLLIFIKNFMTLGASAGNPQARSQALMGCLWTFIATAGLGGVTLFVGFAYNVFRF